MENTTTLPTILAISGSLRTPSSSNFVIENAVKLLQGKADVIVFDGLGKLPHFDDSKNPSSEVIQFRSLIKDSSAVLICSPEYAFGVPGSMKNALDWTVSSGEFINKPVALITAATGGDKAHASLLMTLRVISSYLPDECALLISYIKSKMDLAGNITDATTLTSIENLLTSLLNNISVIQEKDTL